MDIVHPGRDSAMKGALVYSAQTRSKNEQQCRRN
jgi:hypothetical protein